ncbi:hypothetical protein C8F01DRAFT_1087827 [Mycena amicta]|nr:hypothetical protein C8F01DRAFT_1087827 [Mycena amicta]
MKHHLANPTASAAASRTRAPLAQSHIQNTILHPEYANLIPPKPSDNWLDNPGAWMDGLSNPPICFHSCEEKYNTLAYYRPDYPKLKDWAHGKWNDNVLSIPSSPAAAPAMSSFYVDPFHAENPFITHDAGGLPSYDSLSFGTFGGDDHQFGDLFMSSFAGSGPSNNTPTPAATPTVTSASATPLTSGHAINYIMIYPDRPKMNHLGSRIQSAPKMLKAPKMAILDLNSATQSDVIKEMLRTHGLQDDYEAVAINGPPFKMSWTGSIGGRAGALIIDNDADFKTTMDTMRKKTTLPNVLIEFELLALEPYQLIKKRGLALDEDDATAELMTGTKVPRVDDFSAQDQLHGEMIRKIEGKWECQKHTNESGGVGHCWVDDGGNHLRLNMRKKRMWGSAVVAGEATIHMPPNTEEFDGLRNGSSTHSRGHTGPHANAAAGSSSDTTTVLLAAMLPLLHNLHSNNTTTPPRPAAPGPVECPPPPQKAPVVPMSPLPAHDQELHAFLIALRARKNLDLLSIEPALAAVDLTPDAIVEVPASRLMALTGISEGNTYKLIAFCHEWLVRLNEKKQHIHFDLTVAM